MSLESDDQFLCITFFCLSFFLCYIFQVLLSSLTLLTSSCPSLSESVLDTLLGVLPNLTGTWWVRWFNNADTCSMLYTACLLVSACHSVCHMSRVYVFLLFNPHQMLVFNLKIFFLNLGVEAVLVCRCLASIAAHSPGTWSHVSPTLLDYLNDKTEQHHRIIVSQHHITLHHTVSHYTGFIFTPASCEKK